MTRGLLQSVNSFAEQTLFLQSTMSRATQDWRLDVMDMQHQPTDEQILLLENRLCFCDGCSAMDAMVVVVRRSK